MKKLLLLSSQAAAASSSPSSSMMQQQQQQQGECEEDNNNNNNKASTLFSRRIAGLLMEDGALEQQAEQQRQLPLLADSLCYNGDGRTCSWCPCLVMGYDISSGMGLGFRVSVVQGVDTKEQDHTQMEDGAGGAMVAEEAPGASGGDDFAPFVVASTQSHRMVARLDLRFLPPASSQVRLSR
ncbi:unnamed protein product [Sphagnum jensenii]|uniref:Uncharacterized protein n=1 Tax=Sphagnum jensenii TaxID=128206 RepID=A0ABP0X4D5_9BRYO